jgi:dihydrofolate synthase / folylpolyglutamate synthase
MDDTAILPALAGLQRTGIRPGLSRIRRLLARLGHPEGAFPAVLITGTNGKGSTAAFLDAVLRAAGYRVGRFTSPHLVDVRERITVDGRMLDLDAFEALAREVRDAMEAGPSRVRATYFEALTAIGFLAFARAGVDLGVVEVGMGGRFDSTNTCRPVVSVLTHVSLDHVAFLGPTVDAIAAEKVGVARRGRVLVTGVDDGLFERVVGPAAGRAGATAWRAGRDFQATRGPDGRLDWSGRGRRLKGLDLGLAGTFQAENAAQAVAAVVALTEAGFPVGNAAIRAGLATARWPGRLQCVSRRPTVLLDGCHNAGAAAALASTLQADPPTRPLVLVHGSRPDKDAAAVLGALVPLADAVIETTIPGLSDPESLAVVARERARGAVAVEVRRDLSEAVRLAVQLAGTRGTVLVTGSLYLVGDALATEPWLP